MKFPVGASATIEELDTDPHPLLARLRAAEPVSWIPVLGGWLVTRHDLALRVLRDTRFTVDDPRFSTAQVVGASMLSLDGPAHTRHRDAFARRFRPAETRTRFTEFVHDEVDRLVGAVAPRGHAEVRDDLAGPLAVAVVTEALGLRDVTPATIRSWYDAFVEAVSAITAGRPANATDAYDRLRAKVEAALGEHAAEDTLLTAAARHLDTDEVVANAAVLMFGGIDTTEGMITNTVLHLLERPDRLALVRHEPGLLPAAVEESVRLEPAASVVDRYATEDVPLGGARIAKGDLVRVSIAAANRDPAVFAEPDLYDPRRANVDGHLAFAHGPHFCFGAHLARLETMTMLRALLRLPDLRLAGTAAPRGLVFRKPPTLEVAWEPVIEGNA
ncbi:cytochrome P450 [Actinoallomurus rhizosphaericola]|uniref:cytochrome P450 n=1 Tax=Actinoallomurus rhizosphaericola TaxID=2952536 RepID=UPI0020932517|nr:cytochrome P450 [Actinoallomurus rhizosphaericola]MCO5997072.1 cytochrome P450 [Actinoallomurus rhizosphaericola]